MTERSHQDAIATDQLYLRDAYQRTMDAEVVAVDHDRVALDRTVFYATGGGQPHDTGILAADGATYSVTDVRKDGPFVWHTLEPRGEEEKAGSVDGPPVPTVGSAVTGTLDWDRRRVDAHPHHVARHGRRRLEPLAGAGHGRQHGTVGGAHGLRVRSFAR